MNSVWTHVRHWRLDVPTLIVTLLLIPLATYFISILRKHGRAWGGFLVEGVCYGIGRFLIHSMAARFTLRRYCRLERHKENQYLYVPSRNDVKLEIDRVFVNLTLEQQAGNSEYYNQDTLFSAGNRIRVIGDPGSGKSSLIKRVYRDACLEAISRPAKSKLPILLELKNLAVPTNISDRRLGEWCFNVLRETVKKSDVYGMEECFENYARVTGLLVLLDGLDEVASSRYEKVHSAIIALSEQLANLSSENTIVLTMRTQLHQQVKESFSNSFGRALFVKPFSPTDVYEFISLWPFGGRQLGPSIYAELTDRPTLREMCTNPLVLAMYVAERQSGSDPLTPESRTDFYRKVLDELLLKRRIRQTGPIPAPSKLREQRERILGRLAYDHLMDPSQPSNSLSWRQGIDVVGSVMQCNRQEAERIFLEIAKDTGLLSQEREGETFRFIHLTFCEFLAAYESVEGQERGVESLIDRHKRFRTDRNLQGASRLLEVIPFACGLLPRARRYGVISELSTFKDDRLLARCFLETKTYEHPSWKSFVESMRDELLNTAESDWNERWLQDLHLFNVVVRDATQCSKYLPNVEVQVDLGGFYASLVERQRGKSLSLLLTAYARHDAPAAFRLAEVSGLDLPSHFPGIIVANCDQSPFLSLVVDKMLSEPGRTPLWAVPVAEAGLSSRLVAELLCDRNADRVVMAPALETVPPMIRWDLHWPSTKSLYAQIVSLAVGTRFPNGQVGYEFLRVIGTVRPPRGLRSKMFLVTMPSLIGLITYFVLVLSRRDSAISSLVHRTPLALQAVALILWTLSYFSMLRLSLKRQFYRILLNINRESIDLGKPAKSRRTWSSLFVDPWYVLAPFMLGPKQTELLIRLRVMGRQLPPKFRMVERIAAAIRTKPAP